MTWRWHDETWWHIGKHGTREVAENFTSEFVGNRKRLRYTSPGLTLSDFETHPAMTKFLQNYHTYSNKATPPNCARAYETMLAFSVKLPQCVMLQTWAWDWGTGSGGASDSLELELWVVNCPTMGAGNWIRIWYLLLTAEPSIQTMAITVDMVATAVEQRDSLQSVPNHTWLFSVLFLR